MPVNQAERMNPFQRVENMNWKMKKKNQKNDSNVIDYSIIRNYKCLKILQRMILFKEVS